MAVDRVIGESAFSKLPEDLKKEYKKQGDDYVLDLNGYEDPAELRRARDREKEDAATAKRERDQHKRDLDKANTKIADLEKAGGSVDDAVKAKETEMQGKYDTDTAALNKTIEGMRSSRIEGERTRIADGMANKIAKVPKLLSPEIAKQLHIELDEHFNPVVKVLGTDGKVSAGTLDDLEKRILTNKDYEGVIVASRASGGGGAPPLNRSGGGAPRGNNPSPQPGGSGAEQPLARMDPRTLADRIGQSIEAKRGS